MKKLLLLLTAVVAGTMAAGAQDGIVYLSYIKSTGQQAFNTGYTHKKNTTIEMDCLVEQDHGRANEALFGAQLGDYKHNALAFYSRFGGQDFPCFVRTGVQAKDDESSFPYNRRQTLMTSQSGIGWPDPADPTGDIVIPAFGCTVDAGKTPLMIFDVNKSTTEGGVQAAGFNSVMTLYEFKIYENYNLVHDYCPAKKNGVVGLYDKVTGSFSGSITSTPFVAGQELGSEYVVSLQYNTGGTVTVDPWKAKQGEWVQFNVSWDETHEFDDATVTDGQGNNVDFFEFASGTYAKYFNFKMPASNVFIQVKFKEKKTVPADAIVELSYIKSTGQQAFNTNYIHKASTSVILDCVVEQDHRSNWEALFGGRLGSFHHNAFCFFSRTDGQDIPCFNRSGNEPRGTGFVYNERIAIMASLQTASWIRKSNPDQVAGSVTTTGTVDDGKTPMLLFNLNTSNTPGGVQIDTSPSCMTLYECIIYEDGVPVHRFIPAKKNGVVGLYDRMTGEFSGSITATPFVAGEEGNILYPVKVESNAGGEVKPDVFAVKTESWVSFIVTRQMDYTIESITVKDTEGNDVYFFLAQQDGLEGLYRFQMPEGGATINVKFKKIPAGDVNGDGDVTIADFVAVLNAMAGGEVEGNPDTNGDGDITIADGVAVLNIMAGGGASAAIDGGDIGVSVSDD